MESAKTPPPLYPPVSLPEVTPELGTVVAMTVSTLFTTGVCPSTIVIWGMFIVYVNGVLLREDGARLGRWVRADTWL